jgi:hypothetical protein
MRLEDGPRIIALQRKASAYMKVWRALTPRVPVPILRIIGD